MKPMITETDERVKYLRTRLDEFYNSSKFQYPAFEDTSNQMGYWNIVISKIHQTLESQGDNSQKIDVLEFGAARTGFGLALQNLRSSVVLSVQDVTNQNEDFLQSQADHVHIGDLKSIDGDDRYDIIFSTFVWEHITDPVRTLQHLMRLLKPNGSLFIFSPRYDFVGYVPPALRHYSKSKGLLLTVWIQLQRLKTMWGGKPGFWIVGDPALFHVKWFSDSDAIHLVSLYDLRRQLKD